MTPSSKTAWPPLQILTSVLAMFLLLGAELARAATIDGAGTLSLNGRWASGLARQYGGSAMVPAITQDPTVMRDEALWYKREITLPQGSWSSATLELKGARFTPQVYVDGILVGKANGGMAPIFFPLKHPAVKPGAKVVLEIALASLKHMDPKDPSYIPVADQWRSNVASALWDDVVLHLHGAHSIARVIPFSDPLAQTGSVKFDLNGAGFQGHADVRIVDGRGTVLIRASHPVAGSQGTVAFKLANKLKPWTPEQPHLYRLELDLKDGAGKVVDRKRISYAAKSFEVRDKQFYLNGKRFVARGTTVVWHRWMRTPEGVELGYDEAWFIKNIIQRSKDLGANYLRFHLGLPPERFLDLCDRYGLIVQHEWSFFHGMPSEKGPLLEQYRSWLDVAVRHPSVSLIHPYNETDEKELKVAWEALDELLPAYPKMVLADRDVMHLHKYWWSLFENLGLYYDDAKQFPKAVVSDEFGGNYLDQNGDPGKYPMVKETFLRFLGRHHTAQERLQFHADANAKVAEYWRRIGAAGIAPFTALASEQDGNNWFLGPLKQGNPMPVWAALAATFSPQSASLELWDRNFLPGQRLQVPVYVFNDTDQAARLVVRVTLEDGAGKLVREQRFVQPVGDHARSIRQVTLAMPDAAGDYVIKAQLLNPPKAIKLPVISTWEVRVLTPATPAALRGRTVGVAADESELLAFLKTSGIKSVALGDPGADLLLTSARTWRALAAGDAALGATLQGAITAGKSVLMLDVGDRPFGVGYPKEGGGLGPLQGGNRLSNPTVKRYPLFGGMSMKFTEIAESDSHLLPDRADASLWGTLPLPSTRLWNGLRGGLIAPAEDIEFIGLNASAYLSQWRGRGADEALIKAGPYYAYELQGYYAFSRQPNDAATRKQLKERVHFLVQDAPALAISVNPNAPINEVDLHQGYRESAGGLAESLVPLASRGKDLTQTPVSLVNFGAGRGKLVVSQLLTAGRLAQGFGEPGLYGIRHDPVAAQFVLNMMARSLAPTP